MRVGVFYSNNPVLGNAFHIEDLERKGDKIKFLKLISRKSFPVAVVCQKAIGKHFYAQIIVLVAIFAYVLAALVYPGCSNFESSYCMYSPNNERNCFI